MKPLAILLALCVPLPAGTVTLGWIAQPGIHFHVWKASALLTTNQATIELPDTGLHDIRVTAFKPTTYGESPPAEIQLEAIRIEGTEDLTHWSTLFVKYRARTPKYFIRWTPATPAP